MATPTNKAVKAATYVLGKLADSTEPDAEPAPADSDDDEAEPEGEVVNGIRYVDGVPATAIEMRKWQMVYIGAIAEAVVDLREQVSQLATRIAEQQAQFDRMSEAMLEGYARVADATAILQKVAAPGAMPTAEPEPPPTPEPPKTSPTVPTPGRLPTTPFHAKLAQWVNARLAPGGQTRDSHIFELYRAWCKAQSAAPLTHDEFARALKTLGFTLANQHWDCKVRP